MKYSDAISRAFRALKSGGVWGFAASAAGSMLVVLIVVVGGSVLALGGSLDNLLAKALPLATRTNGAGAFIVGFAAFLFALVFVIPLALIYHGGMVRVSDEAISGRGAHVAQGWETGFRRMGRTFGIDFVVGAIVLLAMLVALLPFVLAIVALSGGGDNSARAVTGILGICGGYLVFLIVIIAVSLVASAWEALSIRYGIIGGRTAGDALGAGWGAFKARWKNVVLFALIALGFQYAYSLISSIILVPAEFVTMPHVLLSSASSTPDPSVVLPEVARAYAVLIPLSFAIQLPWMVFYYNLWTAFFRQMTGLDVPPQPIQYGYPPPQPGAPGGAPPQPQPPEGWMPPPQPPAALQSPLGPQPPLGPPMAPAPTPPSPAEGPPNA